MRLFNADGAGAGAGGEGAAGAVDPNDINYEAPTNVRGGAGTAGDAGEGEGVKEGEGVAGAEGEGEGKGPRTLVGDLQKERGRRQVAETALKERDDLIKSWEPILRKLDGREDLQRAVMEGRITAAQAETTKSRDEQHELREIAEDMGWYEGDGVTPDLVKAERHQQRVRKEAEKMVGARVAPLEQGTQLTKAMARVDVAVAYAEKTGDADPAIVREEMTKWAARNPGAVLDNDAGNMLYDRCIAMTVRRDRAIGGGGSRRAAADSGAGGEREQVFVHTEGAGGKRESGPKLTPAEKELGKQYGLEPKDWALGEAHSQVRRGYTRLTED